MLEENRVYRAMLERRAPAWELAIDAPNLS